MLLGGIGRGLLGRTSGLGGRRLVLDEERVAECPADEGQVYKTDGDGKGVEEVPRRPLARRGHGRGYERADKTSSLQRVHQDMPRIG